jgi:group I intron endonuclease
MDMFIIYAMSGNKKLYVGSTSKGFVYRKNQHLCDLRRGKHANKRIQHYFNKYGEESISFEILCIVDKKEDLLQWEQYYIDLLNPWFNLCKTAGSWKGRKLTAESKEKLKTARNKRPPPSAETLKKMSQSMKGKGKGRKATEEQKQKMREAQTGKKHTEKHKQKISQSLKGHITTEETKKKISKAQKGIPKKPLSDKHKEAIRKANLGSKRSVEARKRMSEAAVGRILSIEQKQKLLLANIGKKHTEEHKKKISESCKNMSQEARKKISATHKGIPLSEEHKQKIKDSWVIRKQRMMQNDISGNNSIS